VLVETDEIHFESWVAVASENGIPFTRTKFDSYMRGLSRSDATRVFLWQPGQPNTGIDIDHIARRKNDIYLGLLRVRPLTAVSGAVDLLRNLREQDIRIAVASGSKNARYVIEVCQLALFLDAIVDGNDAPGKPRPDLFLLAARKLGIAPAECIVIEDAIDGVHAAQAAKMRVLGIGPQSRFGTVPSAMALGSIEVARLIES
jgi:HAD superfamily hydrolase (TIGR01509 family)